MTRHSQTHRSVQHHKPLMSLFLSLTARLPPHSQDCPSLHPLQLTPLSLCHPAPQLLIISILSFYIVLYWPLSKATYAQGGYVQGFMMFVVEEEQLNLSSLFFFSLTMIRPSLTSSFLTAEQTAADRSLHMKHRKINKPGFCR